MRKYIKCDVCNKPIYFGDVAYTMRGYCTKYCSTNCYGVAYADTCIINKNEAENSNCKVFED